MIPQVFPGNTAAHRTSGMALLMTLMALAVMTILLLALFAGTSHQIRGAQGDASYAREKMLADSAVTLVIGQIQQASTSTGQTWISQPGLLRTYDTTATRKPTACYKLYSAAQTTDTSGTLAFLATDIPDNWNSRPSEYIDLNASVRTPGLMGQTIYPILNPAAVTNVQGVSIDAGHEVEMPVAWLYQLQDGTLGPASNGTKANPIVARIAFWTDDDTCKININTAGYGSAWNTPRVNSTDDVAWSANQPASGEFSSYPGHPAMTSLAVVFGTNVLSPQQLLGLTPRYAWGGSELGTQPTTPGEVVSPKMDRLYASLDELCFGEQRQANPISATQLDEARFVLTAHSQAPETTLLGEPRIAIWPVSDTPQDTTRTTAADRAVSSATTVGARNYFFQRHDAQSATNDLSAATAPANAQLFSDLVARGSTVLPGYGTSFIQKYPGANWTQLVLEITDFIRGLNAVDPSAVPFVPFAAGDSGTKLGCGFIVPLTTTYPPGGGGTTVLRGLGRCPTLSSLTLVLYVSGFNFDGKPVLGRPLPPPYIDYQETPDDLAGTSWNTYFVPSSPYWQHVTSERVRAFVIPCTFQPGCGFPEVSDACDLAIQGLNGIGFTSVTSNDFGFAPLAISPFLLGNPFKKLLADRAWGGNEGPITWRQIGDALANGDTVTYPFAGANPYLVPMPTQPSYNAGTGRLTWPTMPNLEFYGLNTLTVLIRDRNGNTLQTLHPSLPQVSFPAPTILNEYDHRDGATPDTSDANWSSNASDHVFPSYYMNLENRLLATQNSRPFLIQPGDATRGIEANDLRVITALADVPSGLFQTDVNYSHSIAQVHNLSFADGTSVMGSSGPTEPIKGLPYSRAVSSVTSLDWTDGKTLVTNSWYTVAPCSAPTTANGITMMPVQNINGDWDTGPGFASDGAQTSLPDSGTMLNPATAYFSLTGGQVGAATQRTPNALVPSPVIFGSLPAGINPLNPAQSEPWRTLLFCPYPMADTAHPGFATPPDHLILDNFWMPVVEPYAISTCMATDGKINLNDQIAPFTYLHRNTALRALLDDLRIPAIPVAMVNSYKSPGKAIASIWNMVDEDATMAQIENRFAGASVDAYLSESEICTVPLVPQGLASTGVAATQVALDLFWNGSQGAGRLTGDNLRELPYAQLYSRLTTRSNSYTVHVHVQVLQKLPGDPHQDMWNEGVDLIQGDWRGSYEIERYLDPAATAPVVGQPLGPYKFRIVNSRRFAP